MMAEKIGKSRSSITETLSITSMPEDVRRLCRLADIHSKSLLLQIVRQSSAEKMVALVERLQREGAITRVAARRAAGASQPKPSRGRPRHFIFKFQPREKSFNLALQFRKSDVPRDEIIRTLEGIIEELRKQPDYPRPVK
jgi:ParB family chromosome partitioning protein